MLLKAKKILRDMIALMSQLILPKLILILCLVSNIFQSKAQNCNLVPNPSFENYSSCPKRTTPNDATKNEGIWLCDYWIYPTTGTSDFLHVCNNSAFPGGVGVPLNNFGYQWPHTGSGYGGFWAAQSSFYREYMTSPLRCPLVAGQKYRIRFWVSPSGNNGKVGAAGSTCGLNGIGAYLSTIVPSRSDAGVIFATPQVVSISAITDTLNWTKIEGIITASGGEQFITIGNFTDFASITFTGIGGGACGGGGSKAYYFLDDVYVAHVIDNLPKDTFSFCVPTPVQLQVDTVCGDENLVWTPATGLSNPNIPNPIATPTVTTVYVVSNGCESDTVLIDLNGGITSGINVTSNACAGLCKASAVVSVSGGSSPYSYSWSNGASSSSQSNLCSGTYSVTVSDGTGCTNVSSTTIISSPALIGQFTKGTANCAVCGCKEWIMVTAKDGTTPYNYLWPDGYNKRYKNQLCPGTYTIKVTDKNNCSVNVTITAP